MCYIGIPTRMVFKNARIGLAVLALIAATAPLAAQAAKGLQVVPVVRGDSLIVNFELRDGLTPDVRAAIDSGLKTIFTYTVDLRVDAGFWLDRTVAQSIVTTSVEYDNLERKYTLERRINGRSEPREAVTTLDPLEVRQWMTKVKDAPLFSTRVLTRNRDYYVRVSASARPSYGSILWPFGSGTSAQTKFSFR
ncbi:MAG TPA: DUF4390 domain-containing protein [Vicinamibacterales bacterium]|jgi:hypothetical protein|nr:DUF4390 domain-containing protein [Vicinamibacterales bacterium]